MIICLFRFHFVQDAILWQVTKISHVLLEPNINALKLDFLCNRYTCLGLTFYAPAFLILKSRVLQIWGAHTPLKAIYIVNQWTGFCEIRNSVMKELYWWQQHRIDFLERYNVSQHFSAHKLFCDIKLKKEICNISTEKNRKPLKIFTEAYLQMSPFSFKLQFQGCKISIRDSIAGKYYWILWTFPEQLFYSVLLDDCFWLSKFLVAKDSYFLNIILLVSYWDKGNLQLFWQEFNPIWMTQQKFWYFNIFQHVGPKFSPKFFFLVFAALHVGLPVKKFCLKG